VPIWRLGVPPIPVDFVEASARNQKATDKRIRRGDCMQPTQPILLVDDDESYRAILRHHLEALGYEVLEAEDGAQGCRTAFGRHPRLIILDIVMPGTEGLETISRLRHAGDRTKILAISGAGRARDYLEVAGTLGADAGIEKVRPVAELLSLVQSLAGNRDPGAGYIRTHSGGRQSA